MSSAAVNRIEVNVTAVNRIEATLRISGQVATIVTQPAVDAALGINRVNGDTSKFLNERGQFTTQAPATVNWGAIGGTLSSQTDLQTALNGKQNTLGFTPENVANKSTSVTTDQASNTKYPSVKAVYDWVLSLGYITSAALTGYATQAYVQAQGFITNVVTALGYTPENVANKKTTLADNSDTFYPSQKAVKTAVDAKQDALGFTPENAANKSTTTADSGSSVKFPVWSAVVSYVSGLGYITNVITALGYTPANKAGDTFTGSISASNLSGTNTGDETASGIRTKVGNASASNTGVLSSADWSTFNAKQSALSGTGFVRQDGAATTYDTLSRQRVFSQTTAEISLTGNTNETISDTITIAANTLAANDVIDINARFLKTATAAATVRIYTNTATNLTGAVLLGTYTITGTNRFVAIKRSVVCKASGVLEVANAGNSILSDVFNTTGTETTTTISYSGVNYLIVTMQLTNSADTIRRSYLQIQHQRQAS